MEVARDIKRYREERKLTQYELAEKAGIGIASLQRYERGETTPNVNALSKIAKALDLKLSDFLEISGKDMAKKANIKESKISLLYAFLANEYKEDINLNPTLQDEYVELYMGDKKNVYTKEDMRIFADYVLTSFQNFKYLRNKK